MTECRLVPYTSGCGVEAVGLNIAQLDDKGFADLRSAFNTHGVIFLRDQVLEPDDHLAFARRFGPIVINEYFPELETLPEIAVVRKDPDQKTNIGGGWHADHSYDPAPALGSILLAREVPESGGDTLFANMANAFDALSEGLKATLRTLKAHHSSRHIYGPDGYYTHSDLGPKLKKGGILHDAVQPVVISHPETGREVLYVNPGHTRRIEGWTEEESRPLLDFLYAHATRPEFTCRFRWKPGSMAIWDNRSTWHLAVNDYHGQRRLMHRITIQGQPLQGAG